MRSLHERVERSANAWLKKFALNGEFKDVKALKEAANGYKLADIMSAFCDKEARVQQWLDDPSESNMEAFQAEFDTFILNLDVSDTDRAKEFRKYDQEQASKKKTSSNATEEAVAGNTAKKTAVRKGAAVRKKAPVPTSKPKTTRARSRDMSTNGDGMVRTPVAKPASGPVSFPQSAGYSGVFRDIVAAGAGDVFFTAAAHAFILNGVGVGGGSGTGVGAVGGGLPALPPYNDGVMDTDEDTDE